MALLYLRGIIYQSQSDYVDKEQRQIYQLCLRLSHPFAVRRLDASGTTQPGTTEAQHGSALGGRERGGRESESQVGDGERQELVSSHPPPCRDPTRSFTWSLGITESHPRPPSLNGVVFEDEAFNFLEHLPCVTPFIYLLKWGGFLH